MSDETSAAADVARRIRQRVPGWVEENPEPGLWAWTDPDPDHGDQPRAVLVDGRDRTMRVLPPMTGKPMGPSVVGFHRDLTVKVDLPALVDYTDMIAALHALEAIDALPADPLLS